MEKRKEDDSKEAGLYEQKHRRGLTTAEIQTLIQLYTDPKLFHFPLHALVAYAKRNELLYTSPSTYSKYARLFKLKRPKSFYKPKSNYAEGIKASFPNEIWHIDVTEIKVLNKKVFLQVIIDNYSKLIIDANILIIWNGKNTKALIERAVEKYSPPSEIMFDAEKENLNSTVQSYLNEIQVHHLIAKLNTHYSNSCIETLFRILKYNYLKKLRLTSKSQLSRLLKKYIEDYNNKIPHSSLVNLTPEEAYFGMPKDFYDETFKIKAKEAIANRHKEFSKN